MGKKEKLVKKVLDTNPIPRNITFDEVIKVLELFGFYNPNPTKSGAHAPYTHDILEEINYNTIPKPHKGEKHISRVIIKEVRAKIELAKMMMEVKNEKK